MIRRYLSVSLSILLLITIVIGAALWIRAFYASVQSYRSPLRAANLSPQASAVPQTGKVVIVLLGGLGYDDSLALDLLVLGQMRQVGAAAAMESTPPTYSQTAWATLITGAPPDTNDAPPVDRPPEALYPLGVDTIFARAHEAELRTALFGSADWRRLIPRNQLDDTFFTEEIGPEADQAVVEAALPAISNDDIELVLIHLTQVDFAGQHLGGTSSQAYGRAALAVDVYLGQIRAALDLNGSVLIVLADHGHISDGGHGGGEVEVIWQPLVMLGEDVIPGSYSDMRQIDIAPTLATLLGLSPPMAGQGRILFEMFQMSESDRTVAQILLARQRLALAEAYLTHVQGSAAALPDELAADVDRAQSSFSNGNINGAFQLAKLAQEEADSQIATAINIRASAERWPRLVAALFVIFIWFMTMWRRRGFHAGSIVVAVAATIGLYHGLFQLQGYSYTLSSISDFSAMPLDIIRRTAISLVVGGGLIFIFLILTKEEDWLTILGTGYGFGVLTTFIFALPLFWAFWQNGIIVNWRLPGVVPAFWQVMSLYDVVIAAGVGLLLPWPIMGLTLMINLTRRRLTQAQPSAESEALPGLHL